MLPLFLTHLFHKWFAFILLIFPIQLWVNLTLSILVSNTTTPFVLLNLPTYNTSPQSIALPIPHFFFLNMQQHLEVYVNCNLFYNFPVQQVHVRLDIHTTMPLMLVRQATISATTRRLLRVSSACCTEVVCSTRQFARVRLTQRQSSAKGHIGLVHCYVKIK